MNIPTNLKYSKEHEWVRLEGNKAMVGITDFAQDQLGDVVFVEVPEVGVEVGSGDNLATIESVKAVSDVSLVWMEIISVLFSINNPAVKTNTIVSIDTSHSFSFVIITYSSHFNLKTTPSFLLCPNQRMDLEIVNAFSIPQAYLNGFLAILEMACRNFPHCSGYSLIPCFVTVWPSITISTCHCVPSRTPGSMYSASQFIKSNVSSSSTNLFVVDRLMFL